MSRIPTPKTIEDAPEGAQELLYGVKAKIGQVPNLYRLTANSPATLKGLLELSGALGGGTLGAALGEQIALAIANVNGCGYCNAAHGFIGKNMVKLPDSEIDAARAGRSDDARADAAIRFAVKVAADRGNVGDDDLADVRAASFSDEQIVEIVGHVALNTLTNYLNEVFGTEIDFPVAPAATRLAA